MIFSVMQFVIPGTHSPFISAMGRRLTLMTSSSIWISPQ
jgi:hypothetical protein